MNGAISEELRNFQTGAAASRRWGRGATIVALAGVLACGAGVWRVRHAHTSAPRYVTSELALGDAVERVQATGSIQPVLEVNVGAQVSGRVTSVLVDFNSVVKKGDVLAEIDPSVYGAQLEMQNANVRGQRAQLAQSIAQREASRAQRDAARTTFERTAKLVASNLASKADLDTTRSQLDVAKAQFDAAAATVAAMREGIASQEAQLKQSATSVAYTKIYSPVDGVVITRAVDPGATVVTSFQTPVLFVIAQDLRRMRVVADVDEADVGKLHEKLDAEVVVDAFPGDVFGGTVQQVRYSPTTVQGVVTYSTLVEVDNPETKLRPGMTATVTFRTKSAHAALLIPNKALRYDHEGGTGTASLGGERSRGRGQVWVLDDGAIEPRAVALTLAFTDGRNSVGADGDLRAGMRVVVGDTPARAKRLP